MSIVKAAADDKKHNGDVTSIKLHDEKLYSAGSDGKIKVRETKISRNFLKFLV